MSSFRERLREMLESPRAPLVILALALLVTLPSIQLAFYNDDHAMRAALRGTWPGGPPAWDLYRFANGDPTTNGAAIEMGGLPWWTAPGLKIHLVRPLPSFLFALDNAIFGAAPLGYHLHSLAWYLALVAAVGALLRRLLPRATANLALLLYALSTAHFFPYAWISCRHMLIAAVPSTLALVAFVRDRRATALGALALAIAFAGGETALGVIAFPIAYAVLGAERTFAARARAIAPLLAVGALYIVVYALVHGGAAQSDGYVDPMSAPGRYFVRTATMVPVMIGNAVFGVPAEIATIAPHGPLIVLGLVATLFLVALARACAPSMDREEHAVLPWLVGGAILALVPGLGAFPGARLLLLPNIGFMALLAVLIRRGSALRSAPRLGAGLLVVVHLVLAPLIDVGNGSYHARIGRDTEAIAARAAIGPGRPRVFIVASDPMVAMYVSAILAETAPERAACWSVISASKQAHRIARTGSASITVSPMDGSILHGPFESVYRSADLPFHVGDEVRQCGATYRVTEVDDGKPRAFEITFDLPLDDPSLRILVWKDGSLTAFVPPAIGDSSDVAWSAGPLGAF
jgi:hypothetical protein